jgi:hypothetical protein
MAITEPISPKHKLTRQCFVKNGCTENYENPTDDLIDDTRSTAEWVDGGTDGRTWFVPKVFPFQLVNKAQ